MRYKNGQWIYKKVFTCGCFDIIRPAHIEVLKRAKEMGDKLIVGVTRDKYLQKLKGINRPITPEKGRLEIISSFYFVDEAFLGKNIDFAEELLELKPNIYVKGGDYDINTINQKERKVVESYGGKIRFTNLIPNSSTSRTINKIKGK